MGDLRCGACHAKLAIPDVSPLAQVQRCALCEEHVEMEPIEDRAAAAETGGRS